MTTPNPVISLGLLFAGCTSYIGDQDPYEKTDTATEPDTDTDTDADTDTDTDADTDADTYTDTEPPCTAVGFETSPTPYPLPTAPVDWETPWSRLSQATYDNTCADGSYARDADWYWSTFDLTGDGRADLVVFKDTCTDTDVGTTHWAVYENTGAGYAASPIAWPVPQASVDWTNPWYQPSQDAAGNTCADGSNAGAADWRYSVFDLTGDARADLVVTDDTCTDAAIGTERWNVYVNHGAGFDRSPTAWALPVAPVSDPGPYDQTSRSDTTRTCADGTQPRSAAWNYSVFDLTGDGRVDLVTTRDACTSADLGVDHWQVNENTGAGFDAVAARWSLPRAAVGGDTPFATTSLSVSGATCADGTQSRSAGASFTTFDLTGDAAPDLVYTWDTCTDPAIGADHWAVYPNRGAGFDTGAVDWPLPAGSISGDHPWSQTSAASAGETCADGSQPGTAGWYYTTTDLTGDGLPDVVESLDTCGDPDVGVDHWAVYPNTGAGFDPTAVDWTLPPTPLRRTASWYQTAQTYGGESCADGAQPYAADLAYSVFDLDGDGLPDLVLTQTSCDDAAVGVTRWDAYRGTCGP